MCNTWIEKIDEQIAFSSQINAVIDQIKRQNHWFDVVKIWPAFREPSNVIFYNPQIKHYIKAYVHNKVWKEAYFTEITNINMFNEFCDRIVGKFSWPTILRSKMTKICILWWRILRVRGSQKLIFLNWL